MGEVLSSRIDVHSAEFQANREHHLAAIQNLQQLLTQVKEGGGAEAVARHRKRGKLLPRERIDRILDPGTPFLELSPLAANGLYGGDAPGASLVTGIGVVHGAAVEQAFPLVSGSSTMC